MDHTDSIAIAVAPAVAFAAIADLSTMGRRSPENTGGAWLDDAPGAALGARFRGTNERDGSSWSTEALVTDFEPSWLFAFDVTYEGRPVSRWVFVIESDEIGCRVTESTTDQRDDDMRAEDEAEGFDRAAFTPTSVRVTLERLKVELESAGD